MPSSEPPSRSDLLARSIDEKGTFLQFGYQLCVLEMAAEPAPGMPPGPQMSAIDIGRILSELSKTASRSNLLEPFCTEIADVISLLDERAEKDNSLSPELRRLFLGCARRWLGRVKALPNRSNALALDIFFNIEVAGFGDIAADLFEAAVCREHGAFRASGMMSVLAMRKALKEAKAPGEGTLGEMLEWARESGRLAAADQRCALATLGPGRNGDWDRVSSEAALAAAVRLSKKVLSEEIERGTLEASRSFRARWHSQ